jgi:hypothetical protein
MARKSSSYDDLAAAYPHIARWVGEEEGWIEVGANEYRSSFVRAVNSGGIAWEGKPSYPSLDDAFQALDDGIADWLAENRPVPATALRTVRATRRKKSTGVARSPKIVPVESSMLNAVAYDATKKELVAYFTSGAVWRYQGVPRSVYRELLAADSKGQYMRGEIIGVYPEHQVRRR